MRNSIISARLDQINIKKSNRRLKKSNFGIKGKKKRNVFKGTLTYFW
jgi:hypothetical protein